MISVSYLNGNYTVQWGLTGRVLYHGPSTDDMAQAIKKAWDGVVRRLAEG